METDDPESRKRKKFEENFVGFFFGRMKLLLDMYLESTVEKDRPFLDEWSLDHEKGQSFPERDGCKGVAAVTDTDTCHPKQRLPCQYMTRQPVTCKYM